MVDRSGNCSRWLESEGLDYGIGTDDRIKSAQLGTDLQFSPAAVVGGKKLGSHESAKPGLITPRLEWGWGSFYSSTIE